MFAASVLGVEVTPAMVRTARASVEVVRMYRPICDAAARLDLTVVASGHAALAPLLTAADEQHTPRHLAIFTLLGSPCAVCGWPIEDGEPHVIAAKGAAHPGCKP